MTHSDDIFSFLPLRIAVFVGIGLAVGAPPALGGVEQAYSVALHQHGSVSESTGSMEWHADRASQSAVDLIWWTDHDWRASHWKHTTVYDFENATINATESLITEPDDAYGGEFRYWDVVWPPIAQQSVAIVDSIAAEGAQSLRFSARESFVTANFRAVYFAQTGSRKQQMYSLARRVRLQFSLLPEDLDAVDARFAVNIELSEHPTESHTLRYVIGSTDGEGAGTTSLPYTPGVWNAYEIDVTADAIARYTSGGVDSLRAEDNNLFAVSIGLETRLGQEPVVFFDDYRLLSDGTIDGDDILDKTRDFGALYETMYPSVTHFIGTEVSRYRAQPHMNGYAPGLTLVDYTGHVHTDTLYYAVDQIHAQGGAMSLNHVYGTGGYGNLQETPAQKAARVQAKKRELLSTRAYRADLFEAGYRIRHGIDLAMFLDTWDTLTGNAIFTTANGISDSHGSELFDGWGSWIPGNVHFENNFVTWLWAEQLTEADLVRAMLGGRAFFGDPYVFDPDGTVDLVTAEGFRMGRLVLTDRAQHELYLEIEGMPGTAQVRLLQGEIRENPPVEYLDVNFLRDEIRTGSVAGSVWSDTVIVDTTLPSFVRLEVDDGGVATVVSNPVSFLTSVPAAGVPAPRVAAALGPITIDEADAFTLLDASFSASPDRLDILGDETTPGLGRIVVDCSLLGAPTTVAGATGWSFDTGLLTLTGFNGAGSAIQVAWGAVGAPAVAPRITELALGPGRPNPFGRGTVAELALPRAAQVFVEVLDVTGRRVHVLLDERLEAGRHRVSWNGEDPYGRPVADGVYFLRLTALGERRTTKAVKLR